MTNRAIHIACTRLLSQSNLETAREKGFRIQDRDLLKIHNQEAEELFSQIQLYPDSVFVFTSKHAVDAFAAMASQYPVEMRNRKIYSISGRTEAALIQKAWQPAASAADSMLLAELIAENEQVNHIVHLTSNIRLDDWKQWLVKRGIEVVSVEAYIKYPEPVVFDHHEALMLFSPSQADAYLCMNRLETTKPVFCIGKTTASHLRKVGHENIIVSETSSEESLLNSLYQYYQSI